MRRNIAIKLGPKWKAVLISTNTIFIITIAIFAVLALLLAYNDSYSIKLVQNTYGDYYEQRRFLIETLFQNREQFLLQIILPFLTIYYILLLIMCYGLTTRWFDVQSKESSDFMQDFIHEVKTPLFAIQSSADVIEISKSRSKNSLENFFKLVKVLTDKVTNTTDSYSILSKDSSAFRTKSSVDISESLTKIIKEIQPTLKEKRLRLSTTIEPKISLNAHNRYINLVFVNIVENAIKYSENRSIIYVSLKTANNKIVFESKNKGISIPEEEISHIFERNYRGSNTENTSGSGLGLSVVKKIIDQYNGKIEVSSTNGLTTFIIEIPINTFSN